MPSMCWTVCFAAMPWPRGLVCSICLDPPTSGVPRRMPGTIIPTDMMLRVDGSASIRSRVSTVRACRLRDVNQRCLSGHRDRLFERADLEIRVRGHRDAAGHFQTLAHDGVEAGQRERDAVDAGTKIDDVEAPLVVGDGRSDLFDEHRARSLDGDAGEHAARFVARDAVNLTLRRRTLWKQEDAGEQYQQKTAKVPHH